MEISAYLKLKDKINYDTFENNYKSVNSILFIFSVLGNIASVVFAFFFLYTILSGVTDAFWGKSILVGLITLIALTSFELLKRFLFKQAASTFLKGKSNIDRYLIGILSLLIITSSFYLSINGAIKFSDNHNKLESSITKQIDLDNQNTNKKIDGQIADQKRQIAYYQNMAMNATKSRMLRADYNRMIDKANTYITMLENHRVSLLKSNERIGYTAHKIDLDNNDSNIRIFFIISSFIELIILIGVGFDVYYNHRVFADFDVLVNENRKYRYFVLYTRLLDAVFNNGRLSKGANILTACRLVTIAKSLDLNLTQRQVNGFYSLLSQLEIVQKETASRRVALMGLTDAKKTLRDYYKI